MLNDIDNIPVPTQSEINNAIWIRSDWRECQGRLIGHGAYAGYAIQRMRN